MPRKSNALIEAQTRIQELEKDLKWINTENYRRNEKELQEATKVYKEELLKYVQVIRVIMAVAEDSIPVYVVGEINNLMDSTKALLYPKEKKEEEQVLSYSISTENGAISTGVK